ncbi:MAG: ATP-binding cassette domain-containing protein [Chthoniobacterales bacterium]|nr:ATP-binding cassette domain-containing protein [Chthoniobacterales bacterium]
MKLSLGNVRLPLSAFDLEVNAELTARRTGIFGPSGAGKTSLLETIAGLRETASGAIYFNETSFTGLPVRMRQIGYVPQDDSLFPNLDVRRNLLYGRPSAANQPAFSFEHVTQFLGIEPLLARDVRQLSRGERQRVTIGRALLSEPRLLLLDEPLTGLDRDLREIILKQLKKLPNEFDLPMLYVTHDRAEAIALCDEVLLIERGKIVGRGAPGEVLRSHISG